MQREHIPPLACIPNNRPDVVLTVMDCDHTWITKMERTTIDIVMRHTMEEEEAGIRWGGFKTSVHPGLIELDSALRSRQASRSQSAHWPGNNTVLVYLSDHARSCQRTEYARILGTQYTWIPLIRHPGSVGTMTFRRMCSEKKELVQSAKRRAK